VQKTPWTCFPLTRGSFFFFRAEHAESAGAGGRGQCSGGLRRWWSYRQTVRT
jgi:hypothetical protein